MSVKLTLEFATLAELTAAVAKLDAETPTPKSRKPAQNAEAPAAPGKPTASEPAAAAPAPSPEPPPPKVRAYKDTKIAELINKAVDAGKGPSVKKILQELQAFDPADNTKVKGPFIKPEDFDKAEKMFADLVNKEDLG